MYKITVLFKDDKNKAIKLLGSPKRSTPIFDTKREAWKFVEATDPVIVWFVEICWGHQAGIINKDFYLGFEKI